MTAGERLIQQGFEEGFRKGFEEGFRKGIRQAQQQILLRLLRQRCGSQVTAAIEQRVVGASSDKLAIWLDRVIPAATLEQLLAD